MAGDRDRDQAGASFCCDSDADQQ